MIIARKQETNSSLPCQSFVALIYPTQPVLIPTASQTVSALQRLIPQKPPFTVCMRCIRLSHVIWHIQCLCCDTVAVRFRPQNHTVRQIQDTNAGPILGLFDHQQAPTYALTQISAVGHVTCSEVKRFTLEAVESPVHLI